LAHCALAAMGEGDVRVQGVPMPAAEALVLEARGDDAAGEVKFLVQGTLYPDVVESEPAERLVEGPPDARRRRVSCTKSAPASVAQRSTLRRSSPWPPFDTSPRSISTATVFV
ncbi:hypothetical protein IAE22_32980, partial [Bacillus sp. S34]|nr:hypothetical protein [Bacillus sp. S34]